MRRNFWIGLLIGCLSSAMMLVIVGAASAGSLGSRPAGIADSSQQPITSTVKDKTSIEAPQQPDSGGGPASVFTAFTYQGMLKKGAAPYTGNCDMRFRAYDSYTGGALIGAAGALPSPVGVNNGLFTTVLDFGDVFKGWNRYLEIDVRCPAGAGITETLSPRQLLYGTPYAISLRPGAIITGNTGTSAIIYAEDADNNGTGLQGVANSGSNAWGVAGFSDSGIGVYASGNNNVSTPSTALKISGGKLVVGGNVAPAFIHTVGVVGSGCTSLSSSLFNGDINAMIIVTPRQDTATLPATDVKVVYNTGIWYLCSPSLAPGQKYNILVINQ